MKNLNSYLILFFFSMSFVSFSNTNPEIFDADSMIVKNIESYLTSAEVIDQDEAGTIFSNFLVKEDGDIYTVDFLLTEKGEIVILSKALEEEYYIMDAHSAQNLVKFQVPIANIF